MGTGSIDAYQLLMQVEGTPCLRAKVGTKQLVALTKYFGGSASNLTYLRVEMTRENMDKLGITEAPSISYGKLMIHCTKPGVAKIPSRLSPAAGVWAAAVRWAVRRSPRNSPSSPARRKMRTVVGYNKR